MSIKLISLIILLLFWGNYQIKAQNLASLRRSIEQIISTKNAVVGVSIIGNDGKDTLSMNGDRQFAMQSVFKFPIAIAMLSEIDKGNFSFDQKIEIKKSQLLPGLWSPIREKYPKGVTLTIAEIIEYTITLSDNVGCDVLLRLLGSPQAVEDYFRTRDFKNISIKINEETMQENWEQQFQNWITPNESNRILQAFYNNNNNLLSNKSHSFLWQLMKATQTGKKRLKGQLPKGTVVAHKTGWSGVNKDTGITAAVNNIGIIFLPDGKYFSISVFVTNSKEDLETNEKIISDIAKSAWEHFYNQIKQTP